MYLLICSDLFVEVFTVGRSGPVFLEQHPVTLFQVAGVLLPRLAQTEGLPIALAVGGVDDCQQH